MIQARCRPGAVGVVLPFLVGGAQRLGLGRVARIKTLRENPQQHRQGNKGAGDLDEREPVGVVA